MITQSLPFGPYHETVARLGIGSIALEHGRDVILRQMNMLLDAGANVVDTAQCYSGSEAFIGQELSHRRDEMFLISKCGHHGIQDDGSMRSLSISMDDIDQALRRLRTDRLDAMLLHSYDFDLLVQGDALAVLETAQRAGKIRHVGYSGDNHALAWAVQSPLISLIETSISLADQAHLEQTLHHAAEQGVGVIVKRPLANAAWRHAQNPESANDHHVVYARRFARLALKPQDYGCVNMAELALRFIISFPAVSSAIISTTSVENLQQNIRTLDQGPLASQSVSEIRERFMTAESVSGGTWLACN